MTQPTLYVTVRGDLSQYQKDLAEARNIARNQGEAISNALNNAIGKAQASNILNRITKSLATITTAAQQIKFDVPIQGLDKLAQVANVATNDIQGLTAAAYKFAHDKSMEQAFERIRREAGLTHAEIAKLQNKMGQTSLALDSAFKGLGIRSADAIKKEMQAIRDAYAQVRNNVNSTALDIKRASIAMESQLKRLNDELKGLQGASQYAFTGFTSFTRQIAGIAAAAISVRALASGINEVVQSLVRLNALEVSYNSIFGGRIEGAAKLKEVYEITQRLGVSFMDAAKGAKTFFAAAENSPQLRAEGMKIFESFNMAATAMHLTQEQVQGMFLALGQMISKGKIQAEELRGQLGERLPGAFQLAAKAMGMTQAELNKFVEDGKLTAEVLLPRLAQALREQYGEAAIEASKSVQSALNRLTTEWELFKAGILDSDAVAGVIGAVSVAIKGLRSSLDGLDKYKDVIIAALAGVGVSAGVALFAKYSASILAIAKSVSVLNAALVATAGIQTFSRGIAALTTALAGPAGLVLAAGATAAGIVYLAKSQESAQEIAARYKDVQGTIGKELLTLEEAAKRAGSAIEQLSHIQASTQLEKVNEDIKRLQDLFDNEVLNVNWTSTQDFSPFIEQIEKLEKYVQTGEGNLRSIREEIDKIGSTASATGRKSAEWMLTWIDGMDKAKVEQTALENKLLGLNSVLNSIYSAVQTVKAAFASPWVLNTEGINKTIASLRGQLQGFRLEMAGFGAAKNLFKDFEGIIPADVLGKAADKYKSDNIDFVKELGEYWNRLDTKGKSTLASALEFYKNEWEVGKKAYDDYLKRQKTGGGGGATQAANAQAKYNEELVKTQNNISALEEKLGIEKTDYLKNLQIEADLKYKQAEAEIEAEYKRNLANKNISKEQAEQLRTNKLNEASLQKQLAYKEAQQKADEKETKHLQEELKFYDDLAQLSGNYTNSVALQNKLIEKQAEALRKGTKIPKELIDEWERLKKLQVSTDWFDGAYRGLLKFTAEYGDQAKQWESLSYNFAKSFEQTVHDMFDEFIDTGKISFDSMAQMFKSLLKQMAYQALIQPIVLSVVGGIAGAMGGGTTAAQSQQGAMAGSDSGNLLNLAGGMASKYMWGKIGSSITDTASSYIDSAAAYLFPSSFVSQETALTNMGINAQSALLTSMYGSGVASAGGIAGGALSGGVGGWLTGSGVAAAGAAPSAIGTASSAISSVGAANALPTTTFTGALSNVAPWSLGGGLVGGMGASFLSPALFGNSQGVQTGTSIGSAASSAIAATWMAIAAANGWNPGGWAMAGIAALASLFGGMAGGGIGSLFGGYKAEPGLRFDTFLDLMREEDIPYRYSASRELKQGTGWQISGQRWDGMPHSAMVEGVAALEPIVTNLFGIVDAASTSIEALGNERLTATWKESLASNRHWESHAYWEDEDVEFDAYVKDMQKDFATHMVSIFSGMDFDALIKTPTDELESAFDLNIKSLTDTIGAHAGTLEQEVDGVQHYIDMLNGAVDTELGDAYHNYATALDTYLAEIGKPLVRAEEGISEQGKRIQQMLKNGEYENEQERAALEKQLADEMYSYSYGLGESIVKALEDGTLDGIEIERADLLDSASDAAQGLITAFDVLKEAMDDGTESLLGAATFHYRLAETEDEIKGAITQAAQIISLVEQLATATQEMEEEEAARYREAILKPWNEGGASKLLESLNKMDTSNLMLNIDKSSLTGWGVAAQAFEQWDAVMASVNEMIDPTSELTTNMRAIGTQFAEWTVTLGQLGWTEEKLKGLEDKRIEYIEKYTDDVLKALKPLDNFTTSMKEVRDQLDDLVAGLRELGVSEEYIAQIERERTSILQEQSFKLTRQNEQNLALRIMALQYGSDSAAYAIRQLQYQQENELYGLRDKFGTYSGIYSTAVQVQQAELAQLRMQQVEKELETALQKEISAANTLKSTFQSIVKSLKDARRDLWTSEENLLGTRYIEAYNQFNDTYLKAMAGDTDALSALPSLANTVLNLGKEQLESRDEYTTAFYDIDQKLKQAQKFAEDQLSTEDAQLALYEAQLAELQGTHTSLDKGIDSLVAELQNLQQVFLDAMADIVETQNQLATAGLSQREALIQAKVDLLNATAEQGRTDWTAQSFLQAVADAGMTLETWYQKHGQYEGLGVAYDLNTAWQNIIDSKVALLNSTKEQGRSNWTQADFLQAVSDAGMTLETWYERHGQYEGVSSTYASPTTRDTGYYSSSSQVYDYNRLLNEKALRLSAENYEGKSNWTAADVARAISDAGMTQQQWYELYGIQEGFTLHAAQTTNDYIKKYTGQSNEYLQQIADKNLSVSVSVSGGSSGGGTSVRSTGSSSSGGAYTATPTSSGTVYTYNPYSSGSGVYGSKYNTEMDLLIAKVGQLNQTAEGGKTNWTVSDVQKAIKDAGFSGTGDWYNNYGVQEGFAYTTPTTSTPSASNYAGSKYSTQTALLNAKANSLGMSVNEVKNAIKEAYPGKSTNDAIQQWYKDWGKGEGFASGGITPVNEAFWVGEEGPELMMSPHSYGVLSNRDSIELAQTSFYGGRVVSSGNDNAMQEEMYNVLRAMLRRIDATSYRMERLERLVDKWDKEGLPDTAVA